MYQIQLNKEILIMRLLVLLLSAVCADRLKFKPKKGKVTIYYIIQNRIKRFQINIKTDYLPKYIYLRMTKLFCMLTNWSFKNWSIERAFYSNIAFHLIVIFLLKRFRYIILYILFWTVFKKISDTLVQT